MAKFSPTAGKIGNTGYLQTKSSYGLGSLQSISLPGSGSILRSSFTGSSILSRKGGKGLFSSELGSKIRSPDALRLKGGTFDKPNIHKFGDFDRDTLKSSAIYQPYEGKVLVKGDSSVSDVLLKRDLSTIGLSQKYLGAIEKTHSSDLQGKSKKITSLVPRNESVYRKYMAAGDKAFRAGDFRSAFNQFKLASYLAPHAPESLLSLMHTRFALSRFSYATASHYLCKTLKYFPELPLVPLHPKGFYERSSTYVNHLVNLEEHLEKTPRDTNAYMLLAYFRWFSGDTKAAHNALSNALALSIETKNKKLTETIDIFWKGMVASGRVKGKLKPAKRKVPVTKPPSTEKKETLTHAGKKT